MAGLKICTRCLPISALRSLRISSSLLPENIGPTITSIQPMFPLTMFTHTPSAISLAYTIAYLLWWGGMGIPLSSDTVACLASGRPGGGADAALCKIKTQQPVANRAFARFEFPLPRRPQGGIREIFAGTGRIDHRIGHVARIVHAGFDPHSHRSPYGSQSTSKHIRHGFVNHCGITGV